MPGGLRVGDNIIAVSEYESTNSSIHLGGRQIDEVIKLLQGRSGTSVYLRVARQGPSGIAEHIVRLARMSYRGEELDTLPGEPERHLEFLGTAPIEIARLRKVTNSSIVFPELKKWDRVLLGMTYRQVTNLIGSPIEKTGTDVLNCLYGWLHFESDAFPFIFYFRVWFADAVVVSKEDPFGGAVSVGGGIPTTPVLVHPNDDEIITGGQRILDFRWIPAAGTYPIKYQLQLEFNTKSAWVSRIYPADKPFFCVMSPSLGIGRCRVRAINALGQSPWSDYRYFTVRQ